MGQHILVASSSPVFTDARFGAAVSCEYFAQVKEAQGRLVDAKAVRKRGVENKQMACGNNEVIVLLGCSSS